MTETLPPTGDNPYLTEKDFESELPAIHIDRIEEEGERIFGDHPCSCGGIITYGDFRLVTFLHVANRELVIDHIHAHGCTGCGEIVGFDIPVSEEMYKKIDELLGTAS